MTRRELLKGMALSVPLAATVEPESRLVYRRYDQCLPDTLQRWAAEAYARRSKALDAVQTAADIRERQQWARATFWKLIGGEPETLARPSVRTTRQLLRHRYRFEKLTYEGRPGDWIPANLYIPENASGRLPGVLFQCGHSKAGKAADTYQRCCQALAQLGFVVLTFDPIGQGERTGYPGPDGLSRFVVADLEHTIPGQQLILTGETMTRLQVSDAIRSLDVLASHPLVDSSRLIAAGQSGGATLSMMLAAVDDRLAGAVVSSGNTENVVSRAFIPPGAVDDAEQNFLFGAPAGFDRWDLLWPLAPKPLLILTTTKDSGDTYSPNYNSSGDEEQARLQRAYTQLGHGENIQHLETALPHAFSYELRLDTYRWLLKRFLPGAAEITEEPPVSPEAARDLWCTPRGSVHRDLKSAKGPDARRETGKEPPNPLRGPLNPGPVLRGFLGPTAFQMAVQRAAAIRTPADRPDLARLLGVSLVSEARLQILSRSPTRSGTILTAEVRSSEDVWVPLWVFVPRRPVQHLIVLLDPQGRDRDWQEGGLPQSLMDRAVVCAPDLRGTGDAEPGYPPGQPQYAKNHQTEDSYAWSSLVFGRPLLGQRVEDLLVTAAAAAKQFQPAGQLVLAARGHFTVPAVCAAALSKEVTVLHLSEHLVSWRNIAESEDYTHPFANFLPDILRHTDLPELVSQLNVREVRIGRFVDASGSTVPLDRAQPMYPEAHKARTKFSNGTIWDSQAFDYLL
ncbi:MAG: acetylxylan esterase [Acidobacteriaceae bacterium]|nr:acetylxylan esterase [Acidobacteriaceae bacterium]